MPKVMLIDDDKTMTGLLKTLLGFEGYDVVIYQVGEDVIQAVLREDPDVILLDVNLENFGINATNGFDLLKRMRINNDMDKIGVIMSSGMNYRQESEETGADGFVMKPYMPEDLLVLIKKIIDKN